MTAFILLLGIAGVAYFIAASLSNNASAHSTDPRPAGAGGTNRPAGAPALPNPRAMHRFTTLIDRTQETLSDGSPLEIVRIMAAGPLPVAWDRHVDFVTSIFDVTEGEPQIVLAHLESAQEPDSVVFQHRNDSVLLRAGYSFTEWVSVAFILPATLQPPRSGTRQLRIITRIVDSAYPPDVQLGFCDSDHPGFIWADTNDLTYFFSGKGYVEAEEHAREARALALKVGVAVAMADGSLDPKEGNELKRWAEKSIHHLTGDVRDEQRRNLNSALTSAFAKAKAGRLPLQPLLERLSDIGDDTSKYEALDLCFDIMAADGVATGDEMRKLEDIAKGLSLDIREFNALRDKKLLKIGSSVSTPGGASLTAEQLLGVDPSWDAARVREHLKAEFRKWNNRLSTLAEGTERDNAQKVLDAIAEVRKRHAG